jgi:opacity protein-like surface antigen
MSSARRFFNNQATCLAVAVTLLVGAGVAQAQGLGYSGDREGKWEFTFSPLYQMGQTIDFEGGSTVATDDELGFELGFGYNLTEMFNLGFGFDWYGVGYDADVASADTPGSFTQITGTYDSWTFFGSATANLMEGPFVPYATAGIGWSYIDTGIPDGLPISGCWWDPWYGYICGTTYPTKSSDAFTYNIGAGLRYQFNPGFFMRLGYDMRWLDLGKADGTPAFDQVRLDFGWMF